MWLKKRFDAWRMQHIPRPPKLYEGKEHNLTPNEYRILRAVGMESTGVKGLHCSLNDEKFLDHKGALDIPLDDFNLAVGLLKSHNLIEFVEYFLTSRGKIEAMPKGTRIIAPLVEVDVVTTPAGEKELRYILATNQRWWRDFWGKVIGSAIGMLFAILGALAVVYLSKWIWPDAKK